MPSPTASIVIPSRDRLEKVRQTLEGLRREGSSVPFEVVVVDDGSSPPVSVGSGTSRVRVVRLEGRERSAARNAGARAAAGELLVFLDDDMSVCPGFVDAHVEAQQEFRGVIAAGAIRLPEAWAETPFGRFRQRLEDQAVPAGRGFTSQPNLGPAGNMSIRTSRFWELGGFDPAIVSSEDQDLALRHTRRGGRIAYVPEARAVHNDSASDLRSYCRRAKWGVEMMAPFCRRYPDLPDNQERKRVNGPVVLGEEPASFSLKKVLKVGLSIGPVASLLTRLTEAVALVCQRDALVFPLYRAVLGLYILRGYRRGLRSD